MNLFACTANNLHVAFIVCKALGDSILNIYHCIPYMYINKTSKLINKGINLTIWRSLFNDIMTLPANLFINIHVYLCLYIFIKTLCWGTSLRMLKRPPGVIKGCFTLIWIETLFMYSNSLLRDANKGCMQSLCYRSSVILWRTIYRLSIE